MLRKLLNLAAFLVLLITGWLVWECRNVEFDYNFEHFFPVESDDASYYYQFRKQFGADNDFLLIGIRDTHGILNRNTLERVNLLCDEVSRLEPVKSVLSITNLKSPVVNSFGITRIPALDRTSLENFSRDSALLMNSEQYLGKVISTDANALSIFIRHKDQLSKSDADSLLTQLELILKNASFSESHLIGKIKLEQVYLRKTQFELFIFMGCAIILVVLLLWFTFRNAWGVLIPLSVVLLAIIWTIGIMTLTGKAIDIMIILLPCILFVVGMSDVIHLTSQFYEKIQEGFQRDEAVKSTLKEVGFATFLTCISTAVAFLTLNTTSIQPIRDFGTYSAIGVVIAYLLSITILPWVLFHIRNPDKFKIYTVNKGWDRFLKQLLQKVYRHPVRILAGTAIIITFSGFGVNRIKLNNSVLDGMDKNDPIKEDFKFFDIHFNGVRGFELAVWPKDTNSTVLSWAGLIEMKSLSDFLETNYQVGNVLSPIQLIKGFNQAVHDGLPEWYRLPEDPAALDTLVLKLKPFLNQKEIRQLIRKDLKYARFTGRIRDKGSRAVGIKNDSLENYFQQYSSGNLNYRLTGSSDLIDKSNLYLTENMLQGLSLDIVVLMLIIGLIFKSWRMMLLSILPNIIPLGVMAGIMGWAGIEMNVTISIVFSIAFGIAVDDTLHLLSRLKVELDKGYTLPFAMRITFLSTGKAMILTAMVIAAGFGTMMLSDFKSTFYVGLMISVTLVIALIAELVLMPVLILWIYGKKADK
jgi:predicted RND superfamily exporter protein